MTGAQQFKARNMAGEGGGIALGVMGGRGVRRGVGGGMGDHGGGG